MAKICPFSKTTWKTKLKQLMQVGITDAKMIRSYGWKHFDLENIQESEWFWYLHYVDGVFLFLLINKTQIMFGKKKKEKFENWVNQLNRVTGLVNFWWF